MGEVCWGPGMVPGGTSPLKSPPCAGSMQRGPWGPAWAQALPRTLEAALAQCGLGEASQVAIVPAARQGAARAAFQRRADPGGRPEAAAEQRVGRQVRTDASSVMRGLRG